MLALLSLLLLFRGVAVGIASVDEGNRCKVASCWTEADGEGIELLQMRAVKKKLRSPVWCAGGWPTFLSRAELQADPWGTYFSLLYGEIPDMGFPLCVGDFWMFYDELLLKAGVLNVPKSVGECPQDIFSHYKENNNVSPPGVSWSWHSIPYSGWADNSWVEVIHQKNPFGSSEVHGAWMFFAKGSGMWFNLGKTMIFNGHRQALEFFNLTYTGKYQPLALAEMSTAAMQQGYQSLQIFGQSGPKIYPDCRYQVDNKILNVEIIATRAYGQASCMARQGTYEDIMVGWQGSRGRCLCDTNSDYLNCKDYSNI